MRQIIVLVCFENAPIHIEIHWDLLDGRILLQPRRELIPIQPCNYSSACWKWSGIRGRKAHTQVRPMHATENYSNLFWNYSDSCWNPLGIAGRKRKQELIPVDPVFEIYYYSIAIRANMKLLQSTLMLICRNLWDNTTVCVCRVEMAQAKAIWAEGIQASKAHTCDR